MSPAEEVTKEIGERGVYGIMKGEDIFVAFNGVDDALIVKAQKYKVGKKERHVGRRAAVAASICFVFVVVSTSAVAAIHHFWSRGMNGLYRATPEQQQMLTEEGQAKVYEEQEDYTEYKVTDSGVTIAPKTVVVDERYAYVTFTVSGFEIAPGEEPAAELDFYLGENPQDESNWVSGGACFYSGIVMDEQGGCIYDDGTPLEVDENGRSIGRYVDERGDMEYMIEIQRPAEDTSLLGATLHVEFSSLGVYTGKAEYEMRKNGNWAFDLPLPSASATKVIPMNKRVGDSAFVIEEMRISPISVNISYSVDNTLDANVKPSDVPQLHSVRVKDGTKSKYICMNGGSFGFSDQARTTAEFESGFDAVVDLDEIQSLRFVLGEQYGYEIVEVVLE